MHTITALKTQIHISCLVVCVDQNLMNQLYKSETSGAWQKQKDPLDLYLKYTKILEVNLFAFAYRLFHEDFSSIDGILHGAHSFSSFI